MDTEIEGMNTLVRNNKRLEYVSLVDKLLKNEMFVEDMRNSMGAKYIRKTCAFLARAQMNRFKEDEPVDKISPINYDPLK